MSLLLLVRIIELLPDRLTVNCDLPRSAGFDPLASSQIFDSALVVQLAQAERNDANPSVGVCGRTLQWLELTSLWNKQKPHIVVECLAVLYVYIRVVGVVQIKLKEKKTFHT